MNYQRTTRFRRLLWTVNVVLAAGVVAAVLPGEPVELVEPPPADRSGGSGPSQASPPVRSPDVYRAIWETAWRPPPPPPSAGPTAAIKAPEPTPLRLRLLGTITERGNDFAVIEQDGGKVGLWRQGESPRSGARVESVRAGEAALLVDGRPIILQVVTP